MLSCYPDSDTALKPGRGGPIAAQARLTLSDEVRLKAKLTCTPSDRASLNLNLATEVERRRSYSDGSECPELLPCWYLAALDPEKV